MLTFMTDPAQSITAGVLGVSRGGHVIFLHAYGYKSPGVELPETALFRLASIVKPITAAAIHHFSDEGGFGPTNLQRYVFNLSGNSGILSVSPPGTPDPRCRDITIGHLLNHSAGWDRNLSPPGDIPIKDVREAGIEMNEPDALPTRRQLIDWALKFPLNYTPGAANYLPPGTITPVVPSVGTTYSNFGYLVLGETLNQLAPGGYLGYLGSRVMTTTDWVPVTDWGMATTLQAQNNPREPVYDNTEGNYDSVFDYAPPIEPLPATYGGLYHIETMLAHGGLIASAQAMLRFGNLYQVRYKTDGAGATQSNELGIRVGPNGFPDEVPEYTPLHIGSLPGASTIIGQRARGPGAADDEVIFIAFNKRSSTGADWADDAYNRVTSYLNGVSAANWPTATCDGFWASLGSENLAAGRGGYNSTYQGFGSALARVGDGSYLRLLSGHQNWTGTINKRVRLDAPVGAVTLGR